MTITTKHKFISQVPDSKDASQVRSSNWNDDHLITVGGGKVLLGNASADAAPVAEITMGDGFRISEEGALEYDGTILVADKALTASKFDASGAWAGLVGPGGTVSQEFIVVASGAPNDADGRPNGTLYFRMA